MDDLKRVKVFLRKAYDAQQKIEADKALLKRARAQAEGVPGVRYYSIGGAGDGHKMPDWSEIQKDAMACLKAWSEDKEGRRRELPIARKRGGVGAEAKLKEIHDRVRTALEKGTYRPARDRVGEDLIFMRSRTAGEGKVV